MSHTIQSIQPICHKLHTAGHRLVLATGFFDLLHQEHINFLQQARKQGDLLIVAVESDDRARRLKGEGRPIETQLVRAHHLTPHADHIILLPDNFDTPETHRSLIQAVQPDVLAVSSHTKHQDTKAKLVEEFGGKLLVVHPHNPSISTTQTINQGILSP